MRPISNRSASEKALFIAAFIALAIMADALVFRKISFSFSYDIQVVDILEIIITIALALYLAYVVDEKKDRKKANTEIIQSIIKDILSDSDLLSRQIFEPNIHYQRGVAYIKSTMTQLSGLKKIIDELDIQNDIISTQLDSLCNKIRYFKPILTTISSKESGNDYLEVKNDMISEISPRRLSKIQSNIGAIKSQLYSLWLSIANMDV